jgi:hypothetical protein
MLKDVPFPEWGPDNAETGQFLAVAKNVVPTANGYAPVGAFQSITGSVGAAVVGAGSFASSTGSYTLLAATSAKLRKYDTSWSDVLTVTTAARWYFAQFGDNICYANGGALGRYQLGAGTAAAISGAPSNAIDVATVRDFVMCLTADNQAVWSAFNDCTGWTAGTNQSDFQPLLDGGPAQRIIGGEYAIILQKNAIRRVTYVSPPVIFQFDVISPEVGCMAPGSVANVGRLIFFLSERGFEMSDGESVTPIADEKFNRWFFSSYSRSDIANMWAAINPRAPEVYWVMPGTPGLAIVYNWVLKKASTIEVDVTAIFSGLTSATSLEAVDTLYPSGIDSVPVSLDDASLSGGNPVLMVVDGSNNVGSLTGSPLQASVGLRNIELTPGRRSRLRNLRPDTDATTASAALIARMRSGDTGTEASTGSMRTNGNLPVRANGRYFDSTLTIPSGTAWTYLQGCEYEFESGDAR